MITLFTGYDEEDKKKAQESLAAEEEGEGEKKSGFFSRMREAVTRTRENFSTRINDIVALTREVDESSLEELETALIMSDIGVQTTNEIIEALRAHARKQAIPGGKDLRALQKPQRVDTPRPPPPPVPPPATHPKVTFLVGVNGTGKTTTSGKLASWYRA